MKRVIKASTTLNDVDVLHLIGRRNYDQLYKQCCFKVDDEIYNQYDDQDVNYENSLCTATDNGDGTYTIKSTIHADFLSDRGNKKFCYAELESVFDGSTVSQPVVTFFTDEVEYQ